MFSAFVAKTFFSYSKIFLTPKEAINGIKDNSFLLVGGFGICGIPMNLINAVKQANVQKLTIASNNCGFQSKDGKQVWGLAVLLRNKQVKRMISSYVGENQQFSRQYLNGELQLEICPQGTLAQKISSGGKGIPAFYTATGVGTVVELGGFPIKFKKGTKQPQILSLPKQTQVFKGRKFVRQQSIFADYALVKAFKADESGNLIFRKAARNFNPDMCTAAKCVIAEVEEIVPVGSLNPDQIHVPNIYVDRIYKSDPKSPFSEKKIQKLKLNQNWVDKNKPQKTNKSNQKDPRMKIIRRAAKQVKNGMSVNLGIGVPTLLPSVLPDQVKINLQSENGVLGVGPYPYPWELDPDNINAGKQTIGPATVFFSSSQSFGIIRGGHLDLTMLGGLQISQKGDIANWIIPQKRVMGMGGAMDLVSSGSKVIVLMQHTGPNNSIKLMKQCSFPLTAKGVVNMVITQLAVFQMTDDGWLLRQIAEDTTLEQVQLLTEFKYKKADVLKRF